MDNKINNITESEYKSLIFLCNQRNYLLKRKLIDTPKNINILTKKCYAYELFDKNKILFETYFIEYGPIPSKNEEILNKCLRIS